MPALEPMTCTCGREIVPRALPAGRRVSAASSFATCLYQCECGRGYSNGANPKSRTMIMERPGLNVPHEVRDGLQSILGESLNVRNRVSKWQFGFSTSEDAVTWTIFRYLAMAKTLASTADLIGHSKRSDEETELLLWGVSVDGGAEISKQLVGVLDGLGETPTQRSEPDVMVVWEDLLVMIEVKYRSQNDSKPGYANFARYLDQPELFALSPRSVTELGLYELVRNWRIGTALAKLTGRRFALVNLGPRLLSEQTSGLEALFAENDARLFRSATWGEFLSAAGRRSALPAWLAAYVLERELDGRWS